MSKSKSPAEEHKADVILRSLSMAGRTFSLSDTLWEIMYTYINRTFNYAKILQYLLSEVL